jgi:hypothetical protein
MPQRKHSDLLHDVLEQLRREPFTSMEALNRRAAALMQEYNARPQADLGGLSPIQMSQLLYGDWTTTGALRLNDALTLDDLAGSALLADARTILQYISTKGPIKETAAGNLPRSAVKTLLPQLRTFALDEQAAWLPRTVNEGDILWLQVIRHVLTFASLLVRRRGLRASREGVSLLDEERAGALYSRLFKTFFQKLDLRVFSRFDGHEGLQRTIAYSFYRLRSEARDWSRPEALAETAWLPEAKDPPSQLDLTHGDFRHYAFSGRVLRPLVQFGLMAIRETSSDPLLPSYEYQLTPLFSRFLQFRFE